MTTTFDRWLATEPDDTPERGEYDCPQCCGGGTIVTGRDMAETAACPGCGGTGNVWDFEARNQDEQDALHAHNRVPVLAASEPIGSFDDIPW